MTSDDNHFVFIRPKAIIGSSGTTWASETVRLRQRHPDIFDVAGKDKTSYSTPFQKACSIIQCACYLYSDKTESADLNKATGKKNCIYTQYEQERLKHLKQELTDAISCQDEILIASENKLYESRLVKIDS